MSNHLIERALVRRKIGISHNVGTNGYVGGIAVGIRDADRVRTRPEWRQELAGLGRIDTREFPASDDQIGPFDTPDAKWRPLPKGSW